MIYVVTYIYDPEATEDMDELRPAHRDFLRELHAEGRLKASGPWVGGNPGAYLLMNGKNEDYVLAVLDDDPFQTAGLILKRYVQAWDPVIGDLS